MFIKQITIERAKDADMLEVIQHYVPMKQAGAYWKGKSPFQEEKTPSFVVTPQKNLWKCFASGEGGKGAISFVMTHDRIPFLDAVKKVCDICRIPIEYDQPDAIDKELWQKRTQKRASAKEVLEYAHAYFQTQLNKSTKAKDYLKGRGFQDDTILLFGLGYAPNEAHFSNRDLDVCDDVSLVMGINNDTAYRDFYLDRLIVPLYNRIGNVVGFAGRYLGEKEGIAKYVNPRNNDYYNKDTYLYGIHTAAPLLKNHEWLYLVEGYFNVIRLYESGIPSVANGGTALTESQINEIRKLTNKVILFRDNDQAGKNATNDQILSLLKAGFQVRIVLAQETVLEKSPKDYLSKGLRQEKADIDDAARFVRNHLSTAAKKLREATPFACIEDIEEWTYEKTIETIQKELSALTVNWLYWIINHRFAMGDFIPSSASPEERSAILEKVALYVASIPNASYRNEWIEEATASIFKKKSFNLAIKEAMATLQSENKERQYADVEINDEGISVMGTNIAEFCMSVTARTDITLQRKNGKRRFGWEIELWKPGKEKLYLTVPEDELSTSAAFFKFIMSYGFNYNNTNENYHRYLIQYFNQDLPNITTIHNAGWNESAKMYFFSNAALSDNTGLIMMPNEKSIVMAENNNGYKLSLLSDAENGMLYSDYEKFKFEKSNYELTSVAKVIQEAWGNEALLTVCYTVACCFFDHITKVHGNFIPIFWVWSGQASSGKTKLCTLSTQFFGRGRTHDLLNENTSIPGLVAALEGIQNTVHVLDDFKRGANYHKQIKMLQGFAQLTGHTIFDVDTQRNITKAVRGGIFVTSNEIPTESIYNAFRTRLFVLELTQNADRTEAQYEAYEKVVGLLEANLSNVSVGIFRHRKTILENYLRIHQELKKYFRQEVSQYYDGVEDRYYESATFVAASMIILLREKKIEFPLTESQIKDLCVKKILIQVGYERQMEPLQEFWQLLQLAWEDGNQKVKFRVEAESIPSEEGEVLWQGIALKFRFERLYRLYKDSFKAMGSDITRMLSEFEMRRKLENAEYFVAKSLSTRMPKDSDEISAEKKKTIKKQIVPDGIYRTMCVDYLMLQQKFGLELTTDDYLQEEKEKIWGKQP